MKINQLPFRVALLVMLMLSLTIVSTRLRADTTGTCGGQMITIPFDDVDPANIFFCSIAEAFLSGLTNGTTATTYSPGDPVPREQMAAFITRTLDQSLKRGSQRAALGQWWTSRTPAAHSKTTVGDAPTFLVSDGADVFVSNSSGVSRVRASDGAVLNVDFLLVAEPQGIIVAAGYLWVTGTNMMSPNDGQIYRVNNVSFAPYPVPGGTNPRGLAFDGGNIWTANSGDGSTGGSITRFNITSLTSTTFTPGFNFTSPLGILYDGANLWVTVPSANVVRRVNPATGQVDQNIPVGLSPRFAAFDGTNLWVPCFASHQVYVVRAVGPLRGTVLATLTGNGLSGPMQAAFDGERVLVTNFGGESVSLWKASDLTPMGTFPIPAPSRPYGVCSDGTKFWVSLRDNNQIVSF